MVRLNMFRSAAITAIATFALASPVSSAEQAVQRYKIEMKISYKGELLSEPNLLVDSGQMARLTYDVGESVAYDIKLVPTRNSATNANIASEIEITSPGAKSHYSIPEMSVTVGQMTSVKFGKSAEAPDPLTMELRLIEIG